MTSKQLLREFYYHSEQDAQNDEQLGILNQAYCQIAEDLDALEIIKSHKLLNYVLKNKKCAAMYNLTDEELEVLKRL